MLLNAKIFIDLLVIYAGQIMLENFLAKAVRLT